MLASSKNNINNINGSNFLSLIEHSKITQNGLNEAEENDHITGHKEVIIRCKNVNGLDTSLIGQC